MKAMPFGIKLFGIISVVISILAIVYLVTASAKLDKQINIAILSMAFIFAIFGIGILRLNNICRLSIVILSGIICFLTLISHFYLKRLLYNIIGFDLRFGLEWLALAIFALSIAIYFNLPKIKELFKQ